MNTKTVKGYFLWSIPFLFLACNNGPSSVTNKLTPPDPKNSEWYVDEGKGETHIGNKLDVYVLRFYPEGNYTLCADYLFEQGKWAFDAQKKLLVFHPENGDSTVKERYLADSQLPNGKTQFSFYSSFPVNKANPDELITVQAVTNASAKDPFTKEMHAWRNKPVQAETEAQIKQRVVAYLQFLLAFYQHAKDNKLENPGGRWYPKPIIFFSNKVRMAYEDELADWYAIFHSKEEAVKAYQLISGALMRVKIEGEEDLERNVNCLEQLLAYIEK
nr:hypothetical protein [uncultured Lacibacter sp.]